MKAIEQNKMNKRNLFLGATLIALTIGAMITYCVLIFPTTSFYDQRLRYNEIVCVQSGVNPFYIWDGSLVSQTFRGHPLSDRPKATKGDDRKIVHAYTPWEYAFFGWLTWFSEDVVAISSVLAHTIALILAFLIICVVFLRENRMCDKIIGVGILLSLIGEVFSFSIVFGNYGWVMFLASVLIAVGLQKDLWVLTGISWAIMMIKPQAAFLFIWPIFFRKQIKAIILAGIICICGLLLSSYWMHESPLILLAQIPQIGLPYMSEQLRFIDHIIHLIFRDNLSFRMCTMFILCGVWVYHASRLRNVLVSLLPVGIISCYWTYNNATEIIMWPVWLLGVQFFIRKDADWRMSRVRKIFNMIFIFAILNSLWLSRLMIG